jgi:hypothetical protein
MPETGYHDPYNDGYPEEEDPRFIGDEWKRGNGPEKQKPSSPPRQHPAITPAVMRAYRADVHEWVMHELINPEESGPAFIARWVPRYVEWYESRSAEFLTWGALGWRLNYYAMWEAVERADADLGWVEPEKGEPVQVAQAKAPAEPATEADVDAALSQILTNNAPPEEQSAFQFLDDRAYMRWSRARGRITARTPVPCQCCGEFFAPGGQNIVNCPTCRAAGKKRCLWCRQVFETKNRHIRRCDPCRAREAEWKAGCRKDRE